MLVGDDATVIESEVWLLMPAVNKLCVIASVARLSIVEVSLLRSVKIDYCSRFVFSLVMK